MLLNFSLKEVPQNTKLIQSFKNKNKNRDSYDPKLL